MLKEKMPGFRKMVEMSEKEDRRLVEVTKMKQLLTLKRNEINPSADLNPDKKTLIFTRQLGHKIDIPGSGQWKIQTQPRMMENPCWVCDRHIYSIILWNEMIGAAQMARFESKDKKFIIQQVKQINLSENQNSAEAPVIYG